MNMKFDYGNKSSWNIGGLRYTAAIKIAGTQAVNMCCAWLRAMQHCVQCRERRYNGDNALSQCIGRRNHLFIGRF